MNGIQKATRIAIISIPVAILIFILKYLAYYLTGSIALYSDAFESIVNVIATIAVVYVIWFSIKPADDNHPFGHHKAEYFSAVLEGALIIFAALLIIHQAWIALKHPCILDKPLLGLAINLTASSINSLWAYILIRNGKKYRSPALEADGRHFMTDVVSSAGIFTGLVATIWTGWPILDPLIAIIVAMHILWQGWKIIKNSIQGLMDVGVEVEEIMRIHNIISAHAKGTIEVHDLRTRIAGRIIFIEFHLVVPAAMTVSHAHTICDYIEHALQNEIKNARVLIHIEPEDEAKLSLA
ncbi:MAG: Cation diffusion facilitator family transporter [Candidatus Tokpelaia sp. JSC189]|nr:MAG: Cation diffusion facilitator family transporter [Candidatus Tokpelaia sp. JSC189]